MSTALSTGTIDDCLQFMVDMNAKNLTALSCWFDDSSYIWVPPCGPVTGQRRIIALLRAIFSRYTSIQWTVNEIFQLTHNRFIIYHISDATFKNGTTYQNEIITDITFNEELKISRLSDFFKNTAVLC
jgi:hypothetical protein